jgi:hypothetical protein
MTWLSDSKLTQVPPLEGEEFLSAGQFYDGMAEFGLPHSVVFPPALDLCHGSVASCACFFAVLLQCRLPILPVCTHTRPVTWFPLGIVGVREDIAFLLALLLLIFFFPLSTRSTKTDCRRPPSLSYFMKGGFSINVAHSLGPDLCKGTQIILRSSQSVVSWQLIYFAQHRYENWSGHFQVISKKWGHGTLTCMSIPRATGL